MCRYRTIERNWLRTIYFIKYLRDIFTICLLVGRLRNICVLLTVTCKHLTLIWNILNSLLKVYMLLSCSLAYLKVLFWLNSTWMRKGLPMVRARAPRCPYPPRSHQKCTPLRLKRVVRRIISGTVSSGTKLQPRLR